MCVMEVSHPQEGGAIGRDGSFEALFRVEYPRLVEALYLLTGDASEAEEMAQEALARVYQRWDDVMRMASPGGYAYRVAVNLNRRRMRRYRVLVRHPTDGPDVSDDPAASAAGRTDVVRAVRALPRGQQEAVVLVELLDLTPAEAAQILRIRPASVRSRVHRAKVTLRASLEETND